MKQNKKAQPKAGKPIIPLVVLIGVLVLIAVIAISVAFFADNNEEPHESGQPIDSFSTIDIGSGIQLTGLSVVSVDFPEDGSGKHLDSVLSATFVNHGEKTLQYAKVNVAIDGKTYTFDISTLPVGKTVRAFDLNKQSVPEQIEDINSIAATAQHLAFFAEEPTVHSDKFQITANDSYITVKNISGEDITGEISVFFKNKSGNAYFGGITYRVRVSGLKAGEELSGYSSHASQNNSEIMFVQYAD